MIMTQAEYLAVCSRLAKTLPVAKRSEAAGVERESDLHEDIMSACRARGWLVFHGSMVHQTKRTLGEPDFIILADHGRTILVECKSKTGKLTIDQQGVVLWAAKLGHTVHVVRSITEFEQVCQVASAAGSPSPSASPGTALPSPVSIHPTAEPQP